MATVKVYKFRKYDITTDALVTSKRYATEDRIKQICAEKIPGTEIYISDEFVDVEGMTDIGFKP